MLFYNDVIMNNNNLVTMITNYTKKKTDQRLMYSFIFTIEFLPYSYKCINVCLYKAQ